MLIWFIIHDPADNSKKKNVNILLQNKYDRKKPFPQRKGLSSYF